METDQRFSDCAHRFESWFEADPEADDGSLTQLAQLLAELFQLGLSLPVPEEFDYEDDHNIELSDAEKEGIRHRVELLPIGLYGEVYEATDLEDTEYTCGHLQDDLEDIYSDVVEANRIYVRGFRDEAIWNWRLSMQSHWSRHAVSALKAITSYLTTNGYLYSSQADLESGDDT